MLRKTFLLLAVCVVTLFSATHSKSTNSMPIGIYVNEKEIVTDVKPYIQNGTTFVPVRAICNALNAGNIIWDESTKSVTVKEHNQIQFTVGEDYAYINGKKHDLSAPSSIVEGRTMIPVRLFAESFGAEVKWDDNLHGVDISVSDQSLPVASTVTGRRKDELLWLARIVEAESAGEPYQGQLAVANVVLNRVESKDYPNTIYGVIFDRNYGVQFQPVANGTIYNTPSKKAVFASKRALAGENNIGECLYFLNESTATSHWITQNRDYYTTIHNHSFYI